MDAYKNSKPNWNLALFSTKYMDVWMSIHAYNKDCEIFFHEALLGLENSKECPSVYKEYKCIIRCGVAFQQSKNNLA